MKLGVFVAIVIAIMVVASTGTYFIYESYFGGEKSLQTVTNGTEVSVFYYGYIIINNVHYVFDTNIKSVADDNVTYPKAPDFKYPSSFQPFNFTVGSNQVIKGFSEGLIDMHVGETKLIVVPPSLGYPYNSSLVKNISIYGNVSRIQYLTLEQFENRTGETPYSGGVYKDRIFGWNDVVISFNSVEDNVTIENDAYSGTIYYPYPNVSWGYRIINANSTNIFYEIVTQIYTFLPNGAYVSNITSITITLNFNNFLAGKTLYFVVTLAKINS